MVRADKSDPAPLPQFWNEIKIGCKLSEEGLSLENCSEQPLLGGKDLKTLFESNCKQIAKMTVAAGSLVKGLLMELERRDTHIRLGDLNGIHAIEYNCVRGSKELVEKLGLAFGFENVTDSMLQVRHA